MMESNSELIRVLGVASKSVLKQPLDGRNVYKEPGDVVCIKSLIVDQFKVVAVICDGKRTITFNTGRTVDSESSATLGHMQSILKWLAKKYDTVCGTDYQVLTTSSDGTSRLKSYKNGILVRRFDKVKTRKFLSKMSNVNKTLVRLGTSFKDHPRFKEIRSRQKVGKEYLIKTGQMKWAQDSAITCEQCKCCLALNNDYHERTH